MRRPDQGVARKLRSGGNAHDRQVAIEIVPARGFESVPLYSVFKSADGSHAYDEKEKRGTEIAYAY